MRIYLNGFMGSGKTTIGKALANSLCCLFVDLDNFIEEKTFTPIPLIFKQWGEAYFRDLEFEYLNDLMVYDNIVIACGGGTVTKNETIELMNKNGVTVFLNHNFELIYSRLNNDKEIAKRPILEALPKSNFKTELHSLFYLRQPFYNKCLIEVDANSDIENIVSEIKQKVELSLI
jgi:shikimate kinase